MSKESEPKPDAAPLGEAGASNRAGFGFILFLLGVAVGAPFAVFFPDFLSENGRGIVLLILGAMLFVLLVFAVVFILREPIWRFIFRRGEIELARFAGPLADVARAAAEKRVPEATEAARTFAEIALARYAWVTTRRWLVASITGLVAAIAALAGSALHFEQNRLLRYQSELLTEQNGRIGEQNRLLEAQIALTEAERSASIVPELLSIGEKLGEETSALMKDGRPGAVFFLNEFSDALTNRIIAATLAARPYRYLRSSAIDTRDNNTITQSALARRNDLPSAVTSSPLAAFGGAQRTELIDRDLSPERGQIISMLYNSGIYQTERLSFRGADFSYAEVRLPTVGLMSFRHASLNFADFSWSRMRQANFGAAFLQQARMRNAVVDRCDFAGIARDRLEPPYASDNALDMMHTQMAGADFTRSVIAGSTFADVQGLAMNFDETVVAQTDFSRASIAGSTFRGAMIIASNFTGTDLKSVDLDGAIVFEFDFLDKLAKDAAAGTFVRDRFALEPANPVEAANHPGWIEMGNHVPEALFDGRQAWRVKRVGEFR